MTPNERFVELRKKGFCFQCLLPGASLKHKDGKCQTDFVCKHAFHNRYPIKKHVLVCEDHKDTQENVDLLEEYKSRCILKGKTADLPSFSKNIKLSFHSESTYAARGSPDDAIVDKAIYQLQTIKVNEETCLLR